MDFNKHLEKIKILAARRPKISDPMMNLVEEVGEVATCINKEDHGKKKNLKETSAEECVDVISAAIELFFERGGTYELLDKKMTEKLNRWEQRLNKNN